MDKDIVFNNPTKSIESELPIMDMMARDVGSICSNSSLRAAISIFNEKKLDTLPVVDEDGKVVGVLPRGRLFQALLDGHTLDDSCQPYIVSEPRVLSSTYHYSDEDFITKVSQSQEGSLPVVDEKGKLMGIMGRLEYLRGSLYLASMKSSLLESVFQAMHEGIITTDNKGNIIRINNSAEGMFGIQASDVIGKHIQDLFPNFVCSKKMRLGMRNTLRSVPVIVNQVPMYDADSLIGFNMVYLDLFDVEKIAEQLEVVKELQTVLSSVLRASSDGVLITDKSGKIKYVNEMIGELFGKKPGEIIGHFFEDFMDIKFPFQVTELGVTEVEVCSVEGRKCIISHVPIIDQSKDEEHNIGVVSTIYLDDNMLTDEIARKWFSLHNQINYYRSELEKRPTSDNDSFKKIVSKNEAFIKLKNEAVRIACSNSTVLITGESGVGKDMFARAIHSASNRRNYPFVKVNCAAIPETLFESELFGYAPGSFTGASKRGKAGYFEQANKGTIFLDEIGEMPLSIQVKILQAIQDKEFIRVGGTASEKVDVRIIAATNRDLRSAMEQGEFREDLFYRLNVIELHLPPLRERSEDITLLAKLFIDKYNKVLGTKVTSLSPRAQEVLKHHNWPGNIRELENAIERAANYVWEGEIGPEHLPGQIEKPVIEPDSIELYKTALDEVNKRMILDALKTTKGNKSAAARLLNISRTAFYEKLNRYVLSENSQ